MHSNTHTCTHTKRSLLTGGVYTDVNLTFFLTFTFQNLLPKLFSFSITKFSSTLIYYSNDAPLHCHKPPVCCVMQEWLAAARGKGLEIMGTFVRRGGQIYADMTFNNKAMQMMSDFAIQFNKNR